MPLPKILRDLLCLPTAAFLERAVMSYIEGTCRSLPGVHLKYDRFGNLLAHYWRNPRSVRPLAFVAHTDHPGFAALEMIAERELRAEFRGGVRAEYCVGAPVRFWSENEWVEGEVVKLTRLLPATAPGAPRRPREAVIRVRGPVQPNSPGMWCLPEPHLDGDSVRATACDDLAGVAAVLSLLERLSRDRARAEVFCLFTRAEEVGFVGASAAIAARTLPKRAAVLSIETSSALANAPVGAGPIVRVGDRASIFTPDLVAFCTRVAQKLATRRRRFRFQRRLMDGGMCEASAFGSHGYSVAGICLALGNYHNMDTAARRIAAEYVSLQDWRGMVDLFEALVLDEDGPTRDVELRRRIDLLFAEQRARLKLRPLTAGSEPRWYRRAWNLPITGTVGTLPPDRSFFRRVGSVAHVRTRPQASRPLFPQMCTCCRRAYAPAC